MTDSQEPAKTRRRRAPNRSLVARDAEILRRFTACGNASKVARDMGVTVDVAQRVVRRSIGARLTLPGPRPHRRVLTPARVEAILRRFRECGNAGQTARDLRIPPNQVWNTLNAHPGVREEFIAKRNAEARRVFSECRNVALVAQKMGLSIYTVRTILNSAHDPVGQKMKERYESDPAINVGDVGAEFGFGYSKTLRMLRAAGTAIRRPGGSEPGRRATGGAHG